MMKNKKYVPPEKLFTNFSNLSKEERIKLEELQYRKQMIITHGYNQQEFKKFSKSKGVK